MRCSDSQVRKLMEEFSRCGQVGKAAMKADMNRKTAAKYVKTRKLPSAGVEPRTWRTRADPFEVDWPAIERMLIESPELEARAIFEDLLERRPDSYVPGQLRTLQRRVRRWRALCGPEKEIFFSQEHRPGEAAQTDFTDCNELGVTIGGAVFHHMLCHTILPYSLWQSATVCHSESMASLRRGLQNALFKLGRVPQFHQTDNSTGATHTIGKKEQEQLKAGEGPATTERTGLPPTRAFNRKYLELMKHYGLEPRTTAVGAKEQNGSVEAMNGAVKRALKQQLLLRGSAEFESKEEYQAWVEAVLNKKNKQRSAKVNEELRAMRVLRVERLIEFTEIDVQVTQGSTIRVQKNTYSVPSRLIGRRLRVHVHEDHIEAYFSDELQLRTPRLLGAGGRLINYRHVIGSLVRKPGAFERWRYREELFPTLTFRRGYDALHGKYEARRADSEYLRILKLAAETVEADVEKALHEILSTNGIPLADTVRARVLVDKPVVPDLVEQEVDLTAYNELLCADVNELQVMDSEPQA